MAFSQWGFIYLGSGGEDPTVHRAVIEHGGLKTTLVAVPTAEAAVEVARALVSDGAQSIELCGAFGTIGTARVVDAVGSRVPVGAVTYGMEAVGPLAALFPPGGGDN
jgi:hypothetical protein